MKWDQLRLSHYKDGDAITHLTSDKRKTDQYVEEGIKIHQAANNELCPSLMLGRWVNNAQIGRVSIKQAFTPHLRHRLSCVLRLEGAAFGLEGSRLGSQSLRIGGASEMIGAGYDVEAIKRRGRRAPPAPHQYIWKDQYITSTIGQGIAPEIDNGREG